MRHNDYRIVGSCEFCGKPKFSPVIWGEGDMPTYVTCGHTDIVTVKREESKRVFGGNKHGM